MNPMPTDGNAYSLTAQVATYSSNTFVRRNYVYKAIKNVTVMVPIDKSMAKKK